MIMTDMTIGDLFRSDFAIDENRKPVYGRLAEAYEKSGPLKRYLIKKHLKEFLETYKSVQGIPCPYLITQSIAGSMIDDNASLLWVLYPRNHEENNSPKKKLERPDQRVQFANVAVKTLQARMT